MKRLFATIATLAAFAACAAPLRLDPGLSAPGIADGARLDAAALLSTNAVATSTVAAVYELPVYGDVETVATTRLWPAVVPSCRTAAGMSGPIPAESRPSMMSGSERTPMRNTSVPFVRTSASKSMS